ncbi:MAG: hypothetical protein ABI760_14905 [Ferruginibacter sp.]
MMSNLVQWTIYFSRNMQADTNVMSGGYREETSIIPGGATKDCGRKAGKWQEKIREVLLIIDN